MFMTYQENNHGSFVFLSSNNRETKLAFSGAAALNLYRKVFPMFPLHLSLIPRYFHEKLPAIPPFHDHVLRGS